MDREHLMIVTVQNPEGQHCFEVSPVLYLLHVQGSFYKTLELLVQRYCC